MKPLVVLLRGITGSGKSTFLDHLRHGLPTYRVEGVYSNAKAVWEVFSADHFWGLEYDFDPKRLGEAHAWCYRQYLNKLVELDQLKWLASDDHSRYLVIDNTNLRLEECNPYVLAASAYGLDHRIVTIVCDPKLAAERNVHKVPAAVVFAMHQTLLETQLPSYWKHQLVYV